MVLTPDRSIGYYHVFMVLTHDVGYGSYVYGTHPGYWVWDVGLHRYVSGVKGGTYRIHLCYAVMNRHVGQLRKFQLSRIFPHSEHQPQPRIQLEFNQKTK